VTAAAGTDGAVLEEAAFEAMPDGVLVVDPDGEVLLANRTACRMFGYAREELVGLALPELIPERLRPHHAAFHRAYVADPRARPMATGLEISARRKDGSEFRAEIALSPLAAPGLRPGITAASIRDVHAAESVRAARERTVARREQVAERMIAEAARRMSEAEFDSAEYRRALQHYTQLVRHRIANPLQVIFGVAQTLRGLPDLDPPQRDELLRAIEQAALDVGRETIFLPERQGAEESELDARPRSGRHAAGSERADGEQHETDRAPGDDAPPPRQRGGRPDHARVAVEQHEQHEVGGEEDRVEQLREVDERQQRHAGQ
jgi:PAS domain S-box-containing protein